MNEREGRNFIVNNLKGWKTFNSTELALVNNEDRLVRILGDIRENEFWAIASYLKDYADPKNADKSGTVTDPEVDHQTATGTWRHLSCYMVRTNERGEQAQDGKHFNLVQELRRGFLTTLAEDEARLVNLELLTGSTLTNTSGEKTFGLQWRAVDPDLAESLAKGKVVRGTVESLKYRRAIVGEQEEPTVTVGTSGVGTATTWAFKMIRAEAGTDEDGTGVVTVIYSDSDFTVSDWSSWGGAFKVAATYYYGVPEQDLQSTINDLEDDGKSVSHSRGNDGFCTVTVRANDFVEKDDAEGVGGWKVWKSKDGDVNYRSVKNASAATITAIKATLVTKVNDGMQTSYSEQVDQFGNVTVNASYRPSPFTFSSTNWENYSDQTYSFPAFTDQYGTAHNEFKVFLRYASQQNCWTHQKVGPASGYTYVPSYRGWKSEVKRMGQGRWVSVRVEAKAENPA